MIWQYIILWFGLVILAILNGILRQSVTMKHVKELTAHQLSTLSFIILTGIYIWIFSMVWPLASAGTALLTGGIWVTMTVVFEFGFGHYVIKHPWSKLITDYNIFKGHLWCIVLIWTFLSPWLFFLLRS